MKSLIIILPILFVCITDAHLQQVEQQEKEYIVLDSSLPVYNDKKIVKKLKFLSVVKVYKIEQLNGKMIGYTDDGTIDMHRTNYIELDKYYKYSNKALGFSTVAFIPKIKYYYESELDTESKFFYDTMKIYIHPIFPDEYFTTLDNKKAYTINGYNIFFSGESTEKG
jgi:hypothetical protein